MTPPQLGDTTQTKIFVGGLAWETQTETLRHHFAKYGHILEAVIISDKLTARSKGYGFVTFKDAEAAKKACEDPAPVINGRKANCNLACLGARLHREENKVGFGGDGAGLATGIDARFHAAWCYAGAPSLYPHYQGGPPFYAGTSASYGYSPAYIAAEDLSYSAKLNNACTGGTYLPTSFSYHGGIASQNTFMPVYPMYQLHHHHHHYQSQSIGFPATRFFPPAAAGVVAATPSVITKPKIVPPTTDSLAVDSVTSCS